MMSTIGDAGTSFEESAATMTVLGKEMRDGAGMIGMTGETALTSVLSAPPDPARPFSVSPLSSLLFPLQSLVRMQSAVDPFL